MDGRDGGSGSAPATLQDEGSVDEAGSSHPNAVSSMNDGSKRPSEPEWGTRPLDESHPPRAIEGIPGSETHEYWDQLETLANRAFEPGSMNERQVKEHAEFTTWLNGLVRHLVAEKGRGAVLSAQQERRLDKFWGTVGAYGMDTPTRRSVRPNLWVEPEPDLNTAPAVRASPGAGTPPADRSARDTHAGQGRVELPRNGRAGSAAARSKTRSPAATRRSATPVPRLRSATSEPDRRRLPRTDLPRLPIPHGLVLERARRFEPQNHSLSGQDSSVPTPGDGNDLEKVCGPGRDWV